jgi:hypothetical protein
MTTITDFDPTFVNLLSGIAININEENKGKIYKSNLDGPDHKNILKILSNPDDVVIPFVLSDEHDKFKSYDADIDFNCNDLNVKSYILQSEKPDNIVPQAGGVEPDLKLCTDNDGKPITDCDYIKKHIEDNIEKISVNETSTINDDSCKKLHEYLTYYQLVNPIGDECIKNHCGDKTEDVKQDAEKMREKINNWYTKCGKEMSKVQKRIGKK